MITFLITIWLCNGQLARYWCAFMQSPICLATVLENNLTATKVCQGPLNRVHRTSVILTKEQSIYPNASLPINKFYRITKTALSFCFKIHWILTLVDWWQSWFVKLCLAYWYIRNFSQMPAKFLATEFTSIKHLIDM